MASAKKKLDEEHLKLLREMVALPHNKHCFDCHQRGPTYINMTIGSFICTACSGLLRGLNPPHRVKSISMASFSADEIEFMKNRGNDFCRKVWLGTFDSRMAPEIDSKDESRMREAMVLRYERKRWYVQPTDTMYQDARRQNGTAKSAPAGGSGAKPLTLLVGGGSAPSASAQLDRSPTAPSQSIQRPSHSNSVPPPITATGFQSVNLPSPRSPPAAVAASQSQQQKPASMDLLADFSSDPFGSQTSKTAQQQAAPAADGGFADFSGFSSQVAPPSVQMPVFSQSVMLPSNTAPAGSKPISIQVQSAAVPAANSDKYSALADLESVFSTTSISGGFSGVAPTGGLGPGASVNWGGGPPIGGTSTMWGPPAPAAPIVAVGGVGAAGFGAAPPIGMSPPSYSSIAAMAAAGNPFGAPQMVGQPVGPMAYGAAPAGYGQAQQFGVPQAGYGYFGPQAVAASPSSAGFGMFGAAAPGASQFTVQNGVAGGSNGFAIGAQPAGYQPSSGGGGGLFGGPAAGQQVPPQTSQRASWSHPVSSPTVNPFMGPPAAAGTRATNIATNPFL